MYCTPRSNPIDPSSNPLCRSTLIEKSAYRENFRTSLSKILRIQSSFDPKKQADVTRSPHHFFQKIDCNRKTIPVLAKTTRAEKPDILDLSILPVNLDIQSKMKTLPVNLKIQIKPVSQSKVSSNKVPGARNTSARLTFAARKASIHTQDSKIQTKSLICEKDTEFKINKIPNQKRFKSVNFGKQNTIDDSKSKSVKIETSANLEKNIRNLDRSGFPSSNVPTKTSNDKIKRKTHPFKITSISKPAKERTSNTFNNIRNFSGMKPYLFLCGKTIDKLKKQKIVHKRPLIIITDAETKVSIIESQADRKSSKSRSLNSLNKIPSRVLQSLKIKFFFLHKKFSISNQDLGDIKFGKSLEGDMISQNTLNFVSLNNKCKSGTNIKNSNPKRRSLNFKRDSIFNSNFFNKSKMRRQMKSFDAPVIKIESISDEEIDIFQNNKFDERNMEVCEIKTLNYRSARRNALLSKDMIYRISDVSSLSSIADNLKEAD
jgi:hypothetical protein